MITRMYGDRKATPKQNLGSEYKTAVLLKGKNIIDFFYLKYITYFISK